MNIEIGTVLKLRCCKEILISLNGDIEEKNIYYEFMIVEDFNKKYITVYNVNKQKFIKMLYKELLYLNKIGKLYITDIKA